MGIDINSHALRDAWHLLLLVLEKESKQASCNQFSSICAFNLYVRSKGRLKFLLAYLALL